MPIKAIIQSVIKTQGFISVDEFMSLATTSSNLSYYNTKNPIDIQSGDFITSPEISQMFGEMLGIWIVNQWQYMNCPHIVNLVEFGPGTGILMRDILRVLAKTDMMQSLQVYMVEKSPFLTNIQKQQLQSYDFITWITDYTEVPQSQSIYISNEFFDVLPIKQYIKNQNSWQEVVIKESNGVMGFSKTKIHPELSDYLAERFYDAGEGAIIEISYQLEDFIKFIGENIKNYNSVMLATDYGYDIPYNKRDASMYRSTLQAVRDHKYSNLLEDIGRADVTSHVDFAAIRNIAQNVGIMASSTISQNEFLHRLGIKERLESLILQNSPEDALILKKQYERLIAPDQMGLLFKNICLTPLNMDSFIFNFTTNS